MSDKSQLKRIKKIRARYGEHAFARWGTSGGGNPMIKAVIAGKPYIRKKKHIKRR